MEKINNIQYLYSDALLLASISLMCKKGPAELWEIFSAGDYLDHAIFADAELESGLVRLTKGGWIKESNGQKFYTTRKLKKLHLKFSNIKHVEKLAEILKSLPWNESPELLNLKNNLKYPGVTKKILGEALKKYFAQH